MEIFLLPQKPVSRLHQHWVSFTGCIKIGWMNYGIQSIEKSFFMDESNSMLRRTRFFQIPKGVWE